jgi:hypothetical protein
MSLSFILIPSVIVVNVGMPNVVAPQNETEKEAKKDWKLSPFLSDELRRRKKSKDAFTSASATIEAEKRRQM